ncbi:MAG: TauD/TfdA family dioxygenase, partial [Polaromonas sp.]|nr:TauD/TfdA family dioxygenase [Polaromonas sp.]
MKFIESGLSLGARVEDLDLSKPLSDDAFKQLEQALGKYGVLSYPGQNLTSLQLKEFSERFGRLEVNVANLYQEPGLPEVMILSNMVENGKPLGLSDAGQDWHTDMSYSRMIAFTNVLYGIEIPHRDGEPLGNTEFCNMHAAYDDLPGELKTRLAGMTITHDFAKFWDKMRREKGSSRPALTDA